MSYIINLNSLRKGEIIVATLKSKLKEKLQEEKELSVKAFMRSDTPQELEISRAWVESIERVEKVCKDRKRY